jgi:hypothetical protein
VQFFEEHFRIVEIDGLPEERFRGFALIDVFQIIPPDVAGRSVAYDEGPTS